MADNKDNPTPDAPTTATPASAPARRRWPRRVLISLVVLVALLAGAFWLLGRESTLQQLVQRISNASGGQVSVTGVSGSLYHRMHIDRLVYRSKDSVITADNIDINWSPLQYFSEGLSISELHVAALTVRSLGPSEPAKMPASLAAPFRLSLSDARLDKLTLSSATGSDVIERLRFKLYGDKSSWHLEDASAQTAFGNVKADLTIGADKPFALQGKASLAQAKAAPAGGAASAGGNAQLSLEAGGNLALITLKAQGGANGASGNANLALAPFDPIILRALDLNARDLDPAGFDPGWPQAKFSLKLSAAIAPDQKNSPANSPCKTRTRRRHWTSKACPCKPSAASWQAR
ncbi:hypothetical protein [Janthinobacterium sp. HH01]|uniref:hypothetical protein n=1 Tax=Janthinobacterium sp. HH01 TaxID=1198452 RepID=UPI00034CF17E|nr:hypothetical protein [Janthinobacterium sp. HH01]